MRTYPSRKKYIYELPTIYGTVILEFLQATSSETLNEYKNMKDMDEKTFTKWYIKLLKSWVIWYKKPRYSPKYVIWMAIKEDLIKIFWEISELRYKKWDSIYKDYPEVKPEKHRKRALFNTDVFLAEKCNCRIDEVRSILTDEQIGFILDDANWDYYESFDQWKSTNDDILREKWWTLTAQEEELKQYMKDYEKRREEYKKQGLLSDKAK